MMKHNYQNWSKELLIGRIEDLEQEVHLLGTEYDLLNKDLKDIESELRVTKSELRYG